MLRFFYQIIKDFGALGIGIVELIIIIFFGWKLFANHLKHLKDKIDKICNKVENLEIDSVSIKERISKIEGKIE